jgi:hypothetical protein
MGLRIGGLPLWEIRLSAGGVVRNIQVGFMISVGKNFVDGCSHERLDINCFILGPSFDSTILGTSFVYTAFGKSCASAYKLSEI